MPKNSVSIIILAAGEGSRMKSSIPKVLHKVCGKEMLFYSIEEALKLSDDIHIVLFFEEKMVREHIQNAFKSQLNNITFHLQNHSFYPGTGGALMEKEGKGLLSIQYERVLVLNADMPLVKKEELEKLLKPTTPIVLSVLSLNNPNGYGRVIIENERVNAIIEEKDANPIIKAITSVNAGVYVFDTSILKTYLPKLNNHNAQKEYYLTDIIALSTADGIEITPIFMKQETFLGVNSKSQLAKIEEILLAQLRDKAMEQGVIMHLPHTIYLEPSVEFVGECELEQGVCLKGKCTIINSHLKAHTIIEDSLIEKSSIGPMAHIRPNCEISQTYIGNFVEVKSGKLYGVKAGHLSYLGDCEIDEGSNIGAGVITCNYDGKQKHKTIIGKNVFVGSDTQFIAPVTIASNVLIASGTTVTKNASEGDLVISRVKQENKSGGFWKLFKKDKNTH